MRVLITNRGSKTPVDYTRHVIDGTLSIEDSINVPTLITFQLSPADNTFQVPTRSAYVQILSDVFAQPTGYGSGKILATGFITSEPERVFLGLRPGIAGQKFVQYSYNINATSDEWQLNCRTVPWIPAFVNQTDSQILAAIATALMPGFFDTSQMATGTTVPFFQYDPSQTWSDIAKTFADANRFHYRVINKQIIYQPFGDKPLGIVYDEQNQKEAQLYPLELKTSVVTVPPVNDCIVIGDVEPQTNWDNYFVGDGFTSNFPVRHQVFQGTSSELLSDNWTETALTQGTWIENDPLGAITLVDGNGNALGALNVVQKGVPSVYQPPQNATYIQAQNGLELGGGLNLQHGQFTFNDSVAVSGAGVANGPGGGLIGCIYATSSFLPGNVICGYAITGQSAQGPFTVISVQRQANSNLVQLTTQTPNTLQPGNVLQASLFTNATFLNGIQVSVISITTFVDTNNVLNYVITVQSATTYNTAYGPTADTGHVVAVVNDVMVTASGCAGVVIQPIFSGQLVGPKVISQINHQYVLQTWIGAQAPTRFTRPYTNLTRANTFGAQNIAASGTVTWIVTDYNLGQFVIEQQNPLFGLFPAAPPPTVTKFTLGPNLFLPPFVVYCLFNGIDLNISVNYTVFSEPPQGFLTVESLTGMSGGNLPWRPNQLSVPIVYQLGFGMINQTAQISLQGEVFELSFYTDDIPSVGARIRFQSWAAGQSVARVQDLVAIANEASISGDNGIRSAIMQNLSPLPRTSAECEAAAAAAIIDREFPQFQGTYTVESIPYRFESLYAPSLYDYPHTGEFFYINAPSRAITGQNFFVNTVRIQVTELRQEVLTVSVDYGPDLYLEKLLPAFLEREQNLLVPTQTVPPPSPITIGQVLNASLPTLDNAQIIAQVNSLTGNYVLIDLGAPPITGCEVRNVDSGWGVANQGRIGFFTTQQFTMPRTARDQTWYLRAINGGKFSRYSKALRVVAPLVPSAPALVSFDAQNIVAGFAGDIRDIYGLELRALAPVSGTNGAPFIIFPPSTPVNTLGFLERHAEVTNLATLDSNVDYTENGFIFNNQIGYQRGDVVYVTCPNDASFNGFHVLSAAATGHFAGTSSVLVRLFSYDYGQPYPDTVGNFGSGGFLLPTFGTVQLVSRNGFALVASGSLINNVGTIATQTPHNLQQDQVVAIGAAYAATPSFIAPYTHPTGDAAVFTTVTVVSSVIDPFTFTYNYQLPGGVNNVAISGLIAGIPFNEAAGLPFIPGAAPGTIIQRPVFAPSDLVIDLTQPDVAAVLKVLESATPGSRVAGIGLYFFNLTWDYSFGTAVPFNAPSISGLIVVPTFQGLTWQVVQGNPDGHRVETMDVNSGALFSKYTVDHPFNPQLLTQANLPNSDFVGPRIIKVTPFDALGDGFPQFVVWAGASGGISGANPSAYEIASTFNGTIPPNFVLVRVPLDESIQFFANMIPSQGYLENAPTSTLTFNITQRAKGTLTDVVVGTMVFAPGSNVATFTMATPTVFRQGDLLKLTSPNTVDATAANIGFILSASQFFG